MNNWGNLNMALHKGIKTSDAEVLFADNDTENITMEIAEGALAHVIARLTDLYENPVVATVREIISNAIDSTVRIEKEKRTPISVTLPIGFQDNFIVEDFGEGMSKETIKTIYSQYGASTKQTDLTQIGAYGLGAKAPLSYCSSFIVESTKDGITTEISVSNEAEGNFTRILSSEKTGRRNGTRVTIPVKEMSKRDFISAAETYNHFSFDVPIVFNNNNAYPTSDYRKFTEIPIDTGNGEMVNLDVYLNHWGKDNLFEAFKENTITYDRPEYFLIMSGFNYTPRRHNKKVDTLAIDLVPGLIDFSSSRDSITKNERYENLNQQISEKLVAVITDEFNKLIKEGKISQKDIYSHYASIYDNYYLRNSLIAEIELCDNDGQSFREKVQSLMLDKDDHFPVGVCRNNATPKTTFLRTISESRYNARLHRNEPTSMFDDHKVGLTDIAKSQCAEDSLSKIAFARLSALDWVSQRVIITGVETEKLKRVITLTGKYLSKETNETSAKSIYFIPTTYDTKKTKEFIGTYANLDKFKFLTYDEYIKATEVKKEKRTTNSSIRTAVKKEVKTVDFFAEITINENDSSSINTFARKLEYTRIVIMNNGGYALTRTLEPEKDEEDQFNYKILVLSKKKSLLKHEIDRLLGALSKLKIKGKHIQILFKTERDLLAREVDKVTQYFDKILDMESESVVRKAIKDNPAYSVIKSNYTVELPIDSKDAYIYLYNQNDSAFLLLEALYKEEKSKMGDFVRKLGKGTSIKNYLVPTAYSSSGVKFVISGKSKEKERVEFYRVATYLTTSDSVFMNLLKGFFKVVTPEDAEIFRPYVEEKLKLN